MTKLFPSIGFACALSFAAILSLSANLLGQKAVFGNHQFEDGGYSVVGISLHHGDHPLQKKLGEFYTDNIQVLNALKKSWVFKRPQKDYACGYHYEIVVLKKGIEVDSFVINLECEQLRLSDASLYFDLKKLDSFANRFKKLYRESQVFESASEARARLASLKNDPEFVYAYPPRWLEYDGEFRFNFKCPADNKRCGSEIEPLRQRLTAEIEAAYPGERFRLEESGGSSNGDVFVRVKSSKSLEEKFTLYDRWNREGFGKFEPYHLGLEVYWKSKRPAAK